MYVYVSSRVRGRTLVFATRMLPVAAQPAQGVEFRVYVSVWGLRFIPAGDTLSRSACGFYIKIQDLAFEV